MSPMQSGAEGYVDRFAQCFVEQRTQAIDDGAQRIFVVGLALGAAEMRRKDDLGAVADGVHDGGQRGHDAGVVGDLGTVFGEWHVEIDADEDVLVVQFNVANGELGHGAFLWSRSRQLSAIGYQPPDSAVQSRFRELPSWIPLCVRARLQSCRLWSEKLRALASEGSPLRSLSPHPALILSPR